MSTLLANGNMIRYDPKLVNLASNFFFFEQMYIYLYNYLWVEPSMNIHEGKGKLTLGAILKASFFLCTNVKVYLYNNLWVEPSMNIHEGKGSLTLGAI